MGKQNKKNSILTRIFVLANKIQSVGDALGPAITMKQFQLLDALSKSEKTALTLTELADVVGSSRQNVKKMSLILEKQGYLLMSKDASDARILRVALTEKSADCLRERTQRDKEFIDDLFEGFDDKAIKSMTKNCDRLYKNVAAIEANQLKNQS